jgi:DNA-directed RNA polymerase subunit RPC12/RpoP
MIQGKCIYCKIRFVWEAYRPRRNCFCPYCGEKLFTTSAKCKLPVQQVSPVGLSRGFELTRIRWVKENRKP